MNCCVPFANFKETSLIKICKSSLKVPVTIPAVNTEKQNKLSNPET